MTPLTTRRDPLRPEWIDYNGHLSEPFYVLVMGFATDDVMDGVGLDEAYRERSGCSLFTVEAHVRYLDQVVAGADVVLETRAHVIGAGAKKVRLWHELWCDGTLRATEEVLALHVDTVAGRAVPFPDDVLVRVEAAVQAPPPEAGRSIG